MRSILPATESVGKICGIQKKTTIKEYRPSCYCLTVPCVDGELWYHTLTGELLLLEAGDDAASYHDMLIDKWFLVPKAFDERKHTDSVRQIARMIAPRKLEKTNFMILTTTDCNARCSYCYEKGIRRITMSAETAHDIGKYIVKSCGEKPVKLHWFGGEPLLNRPVIDSICRILRENGVQYSSLMTSNGYYLDAETARAAREDWHIGTIQIPVDGTESVYNRAKAYINRDGSAYQRVLQNIEGALDTGLTIAIRLNMDANNADDLSHLLDEIAERFGKRENLYAHVELLRNFSGGIHPFETDELAVQKYDELTDKLQSLGLRRLPKLVRNLRINHCAADNDACEVIMPDGQLSKCDQFNGDEIIGSIYSDQYDKNKIAAWKEIAVHPECERCPLYPACCALKKCAWTKDGCPEFVRIILTQRIKTQILELYRKQKGNAGRCEDETEEYLYFSRDGW